MSDDSVMISDGEVCLHTTAEQKQIYTFPFVLVPWFKIEPLLIVCVSNDNNIETIYKFHNTYSYCN